MNILGILAALCFLSAQIESAKILLLSPLGSKSHKNFFNAIVKVLAERGHEVTIVSTYPNSKPINNVRDVVLKTPAADTFVRDVFGDKKKPVIDLLQNAPTVCSLGVLSEEIQALKKEKFDLVILSLFFSECYLSLLHHFKVPFAWMSPAGLFGVFFDNSGNPYFPSFTPNKLLQASYPLTFTERLTSVVLDGLLTASYEFYTLSQMEAICHETGACPADMPAFREIMPYASLTILNSIESLEMPVRPYHVGTIFAGGLHCEKAKPLPKDLEEWFQGSGEHGVIFFSLGSAVTPSDMPEPLRLILIKVFGKLKQRVLWKWNKDSMDDLPPNVRIGKWLPQQDILGHPKTKMFITHGGLLSTMEAAFHGCPILGMPLFADQHANIMEGEKEGWAESLQWEDLTEENLYKKIQIVLKDKILKENIQIRAKLMNDVEMSPKDRIIYWVEYVLRHNGAPHLRSPIASLPTYKLYNMDVWASIAVALLLFVYMEFLLVRCCCRRMCAKRKTKKSQEKKKKKA